MLKRRTTREMPPKVTQPAASFKEFFISYNHRDTAWAVWIAWQLEANGYSTIIEAWDFGAGSNFVLDMDRALKQARRMILVLSPNYLESSFTGPEWAAAFAADPTGQDARVIPVRIADVALSGLLAQIVYVDLVGKNEGAASEALLSQVKTGRGKPSQAPSFPGDARPEFPGVQSQERAATQPPVTEPAQADIRVEWPRGPLYPKSIHPIHVTLPPSVGWVRIRFEYNEQLLWVYGPGKVPDSSEFVCEFKGPGDAHRVELKLDIRSAPEKGVEPIAAYFFNRQERRITEFYGDLELVPKPEPPSVVRSVLQTLLWLIGAEPEKPLSTRALHISARLVLLASVVFGYHYFRAPHPVTNLQKDLSLVPVRLTVGPRPNPVDPFQEFALDAAVNLREAWSYPAAWRIEPGFMANGKDGKLRLVGPGTGSFPVPDRSALYDFHMAFAVELPRQGAAGWIVRAQPHSASGDPGAIRGYHFTLTNRGKVVYFSARAIGAAQRIVGRTSYNLLEADERPLDLGAPCCSPQDRIRVQIEAKGFELTHDFHLQKLVPGSTDSTEYSLDHVYTPDAHQAFRYGSFLIIDTSPGPGPAYEFIRLQDAS